MFDAAVIGPVTRDRLRVRGAPTRTLAGGAVHYAGIALCRLGRACTVLTRAAEADADELLGELRAAGARVQCRPARRTTSFENRYDEGFASRRQTVIAVCEPFAAEDAAGVCARAVQLGPLTRSDMDLEVLEAAAGTGARVYLDVQGFLRAVGPDGDVRAVDWPEKAAGLPRVHVLKADLDEARLLAGCVEPEEAARRIAAYGVEEVIVTLGAQGSVILEGGRLHRIPAYPPRRIADATGCGDTYLAGYLHARLAGRGVEAAGRFAAALAALKLERAGPFVGDEARVRFLLEERPD